jgi:PHP family Zn ribbon phosphoesterase
MRDNLKPQSGRADLHIHSTWSDGSLSIPRIVKTAKAPGLAAISITDQDTMADREEAGEQGKKQGLEIIPGIEVSAFDPETGRKVHILGYRIADQKTAEISCHPYLKDRQRAKREALPLIRVAGYRIDEADVSAYIGKGGILYRQHIMHALADRGYTAALCAIFLKLLAKYI